MGPTKLINFIEGFVSESFQGTVLIFKWRSKRESVSTLIRGTGLSLALKIASAGIGFTFSVVVARYLGANDAGLFFLGLAVATVCATIAKLGVDEAGTRHIAAHISDNDNNSAQLVYRYTLFAVAVAAIIAIAIVTTLADVIINLVSNPELELAVVTFAVFPMAVLGLHSKLFQGRRELVKFHLFQILAPYSLFLLFLPFANYLATESSNLRVATYTLTASYTVAMLLAISSWHGKQVNVPKQKCLYQPAAVFVTALPLWIISITSLVEKWLGQILLGIWSSTEDVAIYSVCLRSALLVSLILSSVNSVSFPLFAGLYHEGKTNELKSTLMWTARLTACLSFPVLFLIMVFPRQLLGVFGAEFVDGANALRIMAAGQFVNAGTGSVGGLLAMTGHETFMLRVGCCSAGVMVVMSLILIPSYGLVGAASAQAIALSFQMISYCIGVKHYFGFEVFRFRNSLLASID